jgi:predicted alpha/beta-hydrolase family hydrolase
VTSYAIEGDYPTAATCYEGARPSDSTLLLAHGAGAGQHHPFMTGIAKAIAGRGVDVVTFDFPYVHARRKLPDRTPVLEAAFEHALTWTRARAASRNRPRIFIGGKSMGGRMATHLGARRVAGLSGIISLGYPLRPPGKTGNERAAHLASIEVPLLIVQGTRDSFGSDSDVREAVAAMHPQPTIVAVVGGDHSFAVRGRQSVDVLAEVAGSIVEWCSSAAGLKTGD